MDLIKRPTTGFRFSDERPISTIPAARLPLRDGNAPRHKDRHGDPHAPTPCPGLHHVVSTHLYGGSRRM
ncbi:MAG TPA: hypothetical protein VKX49_13335 [Bryobacteraceae bacterium]|nr:hypothetical protein [Bryobacteraceae bacterium]